MRSKKSAFLRKQEWIGLMYRLGPRLARATFEGYQKPTPAHEVAWQQCKQYAGGIQERYESGSGLMLFGTCGVGKDHLACSVARAAYHAGLSVMWTSGEELYAECRDNIGTSDPSSSVVDRYASPDFLWLSDPFPLVGSLTEFQQRFLYRIVDSRYRSMKPSIVTANVKSGDEFVQRVGEQIADRLFHRSVRVLIRTKSFRDFHQN